MYEIKFPVSLFSLYLKMSASNIHIPICIFAGILSPVYMLHFNQNVWRPKLSLHLFFPNVSQSSEVLLPQSKLYIKEELGGKKILYWKVTEKGKLLSHSLWSNYW